MRRLIQSRPFKAFVCVIVALTLGVLVAAFSHSNSTPLSAAASTVLHPLQRVSAYLSYKFSNFNDNFKSSATLAEENSQLKNQIEEYQNKIIDYNEIQAKLETYEEFLGVKEENPDFVFENATIISRNSLDPYHSFTLNKGSAAGIEVNDPVIFGSNLIGVVRSVTPTTCGVFTIANPEVNVAVYETYSGEVGYTTGTGNDDNKVYCKIPGLKPETSVSPNGIICTTGSGGIFPKDLIVGTVFKLENADDGVSAFARVRSAIDFSELSEVFVITDFDGQGVVTLTGE